MVFERALVRLRPHGYGWRAIATALLALGCTGTIADPPAGGSTDGSGSADSADAGGPGSGGSKNEPDGNGRAGRGNASAGTSTAGSGGGSGFPEGSGGTAGSVPSACDPQIVEPGRTPFRRLTRDQYLNTVKDLFGSVPDLGSALTASVAASSVGAGQGDISQVELEDFQRAAEVIAQSVVAGDALQKLAPCAANAQPKTCARAFVVEFGARAYRAPITDTEDIERHLQLFDVGAATDYRHGIELLVQGMLQSSRFLYRVEVGTTDPIGDSAVALSGFEVATRLAYAFWDTLPDARLIEAAASGALETQQGVADELTRMLADPRGKPAVRRFLEQLVHLAELDTAVKDPELFPEWQTGSLRGALHTQAQHFFEDLLAERGAKLSTLLTSNTVFVNRELATFYGVSRPSGAAFEPLELAAKRASGLLTLPAFLALTAKPDESSPIYRGKFVREVLLCQSPPPPPPDIPNPPSVEPGVSTRERLAQHEADPACSGCHRLIDPIGFGFEHYDAIGRYRDQDGGRPVDARGEIVGTGEIDGPFEGVAELGARLASSKKVEDCVARQWFRYVLSRFEDNADACSIERLVASFRASGGDLNGLPRAIVETDAFRYRRPLEPSP